MRLWEFRCFSSSGWVAINLSLFSSQGACPRNSASLPQPSAVSGPLGFPVVMGFFSAPTCVRGAYLGAVSPPCPFGTPST